jgi:alkylation response protein AidB-like acyl-CoA dehydrogenase
LSGIKADLLLGYVRWEDGLSTHRSQGRLRGAGRHPALRGNAASAISRISRVVPVGAAGMDPFVTGLFAWALLGFGNIYYGLARRAFDWTIETVKARKSLALARSMAYHPGVQHAVAEMALELEAIEPHLDRVCDEWSQGVDHGAAWGAKIVAAKCRATEGAFRVVDLALEVAGGFGVFHRSGLERMFRDARLGRIHPANGFLARRSGSTLTSSRAGASEGLARAVDDE